MSPGRLFPVIRLALCSGYGPLVVPSLEVSMFSIGVFPIGMEHLCPSFWGFPRRFSSRDGPFVSSVWRLHHFVRRFILWGW